MAVMRAADSLYWRRWGGGGRPAIIWVMYTSFSPCSSCSTLMNDHVGMTGHHTGLHVN